MKLDMVDVEDLLSQDARILLVDVRTQEEYEDGHIPGAGCMPHDVICDCLYDEPLFERGLDDIANMSGMEMADDAAAIVLYGDLERSEAACTHMEALGFTNVYDAGSMEDWHAELAYGPAAGSLASDDDCCCGHHDHDHDHGHDHHHHHE